jgi:hypothetical protein
MHRAVVALLALAPAALAAQQAELRVDAIWTTRPVWHVGAGVTAAAGNYVRVSSLVGYALEGAAGRRVRGEVIGRLTLDPFRRRSVGFSIGGGLGVARDAYLIAVAELEGGAWRGVTPALQVGVGKGYRAGLVVRRAVTGRR